MGVKNRNSSGETKIVEFSEAHDYLSHVTRLLMSHYNAHAGVYVVEIPLNRLAYDLKGYISAYGVTALGKFRHFVGVSSSWFTLQIMSEVNLILKSNGLKPADPAHTVKYMRLLSDLENADDWGKGFGVAVRRAIFPQIAPSEFETIFKLLSNWKQNVELQPFLIELGFSNKEIAEIQKAAFILRG
jgi:hypothetical protein